MEKYQKFALQQYAMGLADQYTTMMSFLEEIKYLLRIQNRQEEAELINDAILRVKRASEVFECNPVQSPDEKV